MKVLFVDTVNPLIFNELEKNKILCDTAYNKTKNEISKIINQYEGIVIRSRFKIDKDFINAAKNLKFIARAGSGTENIDIHYARSKKIICFNAAAGNRQAVAEHALAMILSLLNNINHSDSEIRNGIWNREANRGTEISGKTFGIIGLGNNGMAFANLLKSFNVKILAYDKYRMSYPYQTNMQHIYKEADFISLHIPLSKETKYLVNDHFIKQFKKPIYVINTSRGKCVKTSSLVKGLKNKKILGACLDVLEQETISYESLVVNNKIKDLKYLFDSKKTILTPHIAGWTKESDIKIAKIIGKKIIKKLKTS